MKLPNDRHVVRLNIHPVLAQDRAHHARAECRQRTRRALRPKNKSTQAQQQRNRRCRRPSAWLTPPWERHHTCPRQNRCAQLPWNGSTHKLSRHRPVKGLLLLPPLRQFGISPHFLQRGKNLRVRFVTHASPSGAVSDQNSFGFSVGHKFVAPSEVMARSTIIRCSCASPRAIRDFTVPSGNSSVRAMSSYE